MGKGIHHHQIEANGKSSPWGQGAIAAVGVGFPGIAYGGGGVGANSLYGSGAGANGFLYIVKG